MTADHGDGLMEHGFFDHSNSPYEELIRVPLIIKFPNSLYGGTIVKRQVQLIDVMPTILDFLRIKTHSKLSGFSLLNYLNNTERKEDNFPMYAYSEFVRATSFTSIRTERYKYIYSPHKKDEFYDLSVDPLEQHNIIDLKPDEGEKFYKMTLNIVQERERRRKDVREVILDKKAVEELKALGYIQ